MKNTHYESAFHPRLPKQLQMERIQKAIRRELTPLQQQTLIAYYLHKKNTSQIAAERGVHKSTVCRTLRRAESRLRHYFQY